MYCQLGPHLLSYGKWGLLEGRAGEHSRSPRKLDHDSGPRNHQLACSPSFLPCTVPLTQHLGKESKVSSGSHFGTHGHTSRLCSPLVRLGFSGNKFPVFAAPSYCHWAFPGKYFRDTHFWLSGWEKHLNSQEPGVQGPSSTGDVFNPKSGPLQSHQHLPF